MKKHLSTPESARRAEIEALAARYFEAETTGDEERRLVRLLATPEGRDARFDELRAVIGFTAVGRRLARAGARPAAAAHRWPVPRRRWPAVAAAVAALFLAGPAVWLAGRAAGAWGGGDVCVAYIGGRRTTDAEVVMQEMRRSLGQVASVAEAPGVEAQLSDLFDTLNQEQSVSQP